MPWFDVTFRDARTGNLVVQSTEAESATDAEVKYGRRVQASHPDWEVVRVERVPLHRDPATQPGQAIHEVFNEGLKWVVIAVTFGAFGGALVRLFG